MKRHNICKRHGFLDAGFKQTELLPFSPHYPKGLTAFKYKFEETVPNLSVNSGNRNSQDCHKYLCRLICLEIKTRYNFISTIWIFIYQDIHYQNAEEGPNFEMKMLAIFKHHFDHGIQGQR